MHSDYRTSQKAMLLFTSSLFGQDLVHCIPCAACVGLCLTACADAGAPPTRGELGVAADAKLLGPRAVRGRTLTRKV